MSLTKLKPLSSAIKASPLTLKNPIFKPTITLQILETTLSQCKNITQFNQILSRMILTGFLNDTYAESRLLKFSTDSHFIPINHSLHVFAHIHNRNGFIYNTMMRALLNRNGSCNVMSVYKLMLSNCVEPDHYTYPILVQSCAVREASFEGELIHGHVLKLGFGCDVYVVNTLINMYAVCRKLIDSRKVFDESDVLDLVSWNSIVAGYVLAGDVEEAKYLYDRMPEKNVIASNSMIVLFGKKGNVLEACRLFNDMAERDLVSWSALISCYEQNEMYDETLVWFKEMNLNGVMADEVVVLTVLSACAHLLNVAMGRSIHGLTVKIGIECFVNLQNALIHMYSSGGELESAEKLFSGGLLLDQISWNSMISGYMKRGKLEQAEALFNEMPERDNVSWGAMISGYAQHDKFFVALALFLEMQLCGIQPDETILVSVISACTHLAVIDLGKWIHAYVFKHGVHINPFVGTTLVDMYMKFGCVENAMEVFNEMGQKGVSTWNALILGFAMNGLVDKSLDMFSKMRECSVAPNEITFLAVLGACRHMGLVDQGRRFFDAMIRDYKIEANVKHYGCMVDLLGRAGMLKEAEEFIETMPMAPDVSTWGALLGACRKYGNREMGERVGKKLIELHPDHDGFHVLLSNIQASRGKWDDVSEIRGLMRQNKVVKTPGCSMIEANGIVHEFLAGDKTHPQIRDIEKMLDEIAQKLKMEGYAPDTHEVLLDIDEEEKETNLFRHSEKLAIAFGLIAITPPTPIRIMKNLRICNDCHTAAKLISKAFGREIVVRDRHRFHHFKHGSCSCSDYW